MTEQTTTVPVARFIKEIGRGKNGARDLSRDDARDLYAAMLNGQVGELELGAIWMAMRIKGESLDELAGFMEAAEESMEKFAVPPDTQHAPVLIPSYNGARNKANLTPLLAMLLARHGIPVLVHGVTTDPGRVTTAEIFQEMGLPWVETAAEADVQFQKKLPAFMRIEHLSPAMARLLAFRQRIGLRSSTHTLVKLAQPFEHAALRLISYTHPEYANLMRDYFLHHVPGTRGAAFLMRATEGETVASSARAQQIDWLHDGHNTTLIYRDAVAPVQEIELPSRDATATANWIMEVLQGRQPVPHNLAVQVEHCERVARMLHESLRNDFPQMQTIVNGA